MSFTTSTMYVSEEEFYDDGFGHGTYNNSKLENGFSASTGTASNQYSCCSSSSCFDNIWTHPKHDSHGDLLERILDTMPCCAL